MGYGSTERLAVENMPSPKSNWFVPLIFNCLLLLQTPGVFGFIGVSVYIFSNY